MTHTLNSKFERCSYCQGSGTVIQPGPIAPSYQQRLSRGIATCPRCYGSGEDRSRARSSASQSFGKSPSEIQGKKTGKGCATAIFSVTPYAIVLSAVYSLIIHATKALSSSYALNIPEWLPSLASLIVFCIVLFYKRYIGWMAILGIAILIGISLLPNDNKIKPVQKNTQPQITDRKNNFGATKANVPSRENEKIKLCDACAKTLNPNVKLPAWIKDGKKKACNKYQAECSKLGYKW